MITDEQLGLKIAESPEEALWTKVKEAREAAIKSHEDALIVEREFLKTAEAMLEKFKK
jgi:hypothetical protein